MNQPGGWKASLSGVLRKHNGVKTNGTVSSFATRDKRADVLFAGFKQLRELGFKLETVESFLEKHMVALIREWERRGLSPATIQSNISIFRVFANWIGKAGMIQGSEKYVTDPSSVKRCTIAKEDKSWDAQGVDIQTKILEVAEKDPRAAMALELQHAFGLRAREALQLRPHIADKGVYLHLHAGTKGGRERIVPIDTAYKREVLERAKEFAANKSSSISDPAKRLSQVKNHYYFVLRECGIKRINGITTHGLRHGYAHERYQMIAGEMAPVKESATVCQVDREDDRAARIEVAQELGHGRESVTTHYLGR
jgi:integrase